MSKARENPVPFSAISRGGDLTLRDLFAAAALAGLACHSDRPLTTAASAYVLADAMLQARAVTP